MADKKESNLEALKAGIDNKMKTRATRRGFLKKALFAGVAATATATVAKKTVDMIPGEDPQKQYLKDVLPGDRVASAREYVVMSREEKKALVKTFEGNYKKEA